MKTKSASAWFFGDRRCATALRIAAIVSGQSGIRRIEPVFTRGKVIQPAFRSTADCGRLATSVWPNPQLTPSMIMHFLSTSSAVVQHLLDFWPPGTSSCWPQCTSLADVLLARHLEHGTESNGTLDQPSVKCVLEDDTRQPDDVADTDETPGLCKRRPQRLEIVRSQIARRGGSAKRGN